MITSVPWGRGSGFAVAGRAPFAVIMQFRRVAPRRTELHDHGSLALSGEAARPGVALEERVRCDGPAGVPHLGDGAVRADLADPGGLGDVVVGSVDRHGALGGVEGDAVGGGLDLLDV